MEVKDHVILYLDILGYKNLIKSCEDENVYLERVHYMMNSLANHIETRNKMVDAKAAGYNLNLSRFQSILFSDNILFFAPYDSETDMHNLYGNLFYGLSEFLFQYQKTDLFFRGAITRGKLYYDKDLHFVFGTGLIRAYDMESNAAIYPRIIIDECMNPSPILVGWEKDDQGVWFLDYLTLGYALMGKHGADQGQLLSKEQMEVYLLELAESIENALEKNKECEHIYQKYLWLANYYNKFCEKWKIGEKLKGTYVSKIKDMHRTD